MNIRTAIECLLDRWERWQDKRFRAALRRANRRNRVIRIGPKPDSKCVVHNEPRR